MLEDESGPIANSVGSFDAPPPAAPLNERQRKLLEMKAKLMSEVEPPEMPGHVADALSRCSRQLGANAIVWRGAPLDAGSVARAILAQTKVENPAGMIGLRHRFEAMTGIDCRDMFWAQKPQNLSARVIVEDYLRTHTSAQGRTGARYFFGREVPATA